MRNKWNFAKGKTYYPIYEIFLFFHFVATEQQEEKFVSSTFSITFKRDYKAIRKLYTM